MLTELLLRHVVLLQGHCVFAVFCHSSLCLVLFICNMSRVAIQVYPHENAQKVTTKSLMSNLFMLVLESKHFLYFTI